MSRRHKDNDIEKPLAKGDLVNSNEQNLKDGFEILVSDKKLS